LLALGFRVYQSCGYYYLQRRVGDSWLYFPANGPLLLRHLLEEGTMAATATIPTAMNDETNRLSAHGYISKGLVFDLVAIQQGAAMSTTRWRSGQLRLKGNTLLVFIDCQKTILCQPQEVQGQLFRNVLPGKGFLTGAIMEPRYGEFYRGPMMNFNNQDRQSISREARE